MKFIYFLSLFIFLSFFVSAAGFSSSVSLSPEVDEKSFSVSEALILYTGEENSIFTILLTNDLSKKQDFIIEVTGGFISVDKNSFSLESGEDTSFKVTLKNKDLAPGVYIGNIVLSGESSKKIPIVSQIQTKESLLIFDVDSQIPLPRILSPDGSLSNLK